MSLTSTPSLEFSKLTKASFSEEPFTPSAATVVFKVPSLTSGMVLGSFSFSNLIRFGVTNFVPSKFW